MLTPYSTSIPGTIFKMVSLQTHIYKTFSQPSGSSGTQPTPVTPLLLDVYTPTNPASVTLLFFHAGGLVSYNRKCLSPHLLKSALSRNWTFVSADYRLLPQATGQDLWDDARDAYEFVVTKLPGILGQNHEGNRSVKRKIVVAGASAGTYLPFLIASNSSKLPQRPTAILSYYGIPTFTHPFFNSSHIFGSHIEREELTHILDDRRVLTSTPDGDPAFDIACLNSDLSKNINFIMKKRKAREGYGRPDNYDWLVQENLYPKIFGEVEGSDRSTKSVFLHSVGDLDVPFACSEDFVKEVGRETTRLVSVEGADHNFDQGLFLEDGGERIEKIKVAWKLIDDIVEHGAFEE